MPKRNLPNNHAVGNRPHRNDSFFRRAFGKALRCKELGAQVSRVEPASRCAAAASPAWASVLRMASICWFCPTILWNDVKHVPFGSVKRCECV